MKRYFVWMATAGLLLSSCKNRSADIASDMTQAFPDPIFRAYVLEHFDTDGNGRISTAEAEAVTDIFVYDMTGTDATKKIHSLEGVQYFMNLTELNCADNLLTTLDVSKNTALKLLVCGKNQLTALDVSQNTALKKLICHENQLTSLDVSQNTALIYLNCDSNQLTALDVSKNTALLQLSCHSNQLTALDVSHNPKLTSDLACYDNPLKTLTLKSGQEAKRMEIPDGTELVYVD